MRKFLFDLKLLNSQNKIQNNTILFNFTLNIKKNIYVHMYIMYSDYILKISIGFYELILFFTQKYKWK